MSEENTSTHAESAFALRTAFKQSQSQLTQAHLFEKLGYHLFESGWSDELMQWWLDELCLQYGAQHGQITQQHAGALKIVAKRGKTFPQGTRIPMMGALALWLKTPLKFEFHTQHIPSLWTITADEVVTTPYYFTHVPIAYHQQPVGLLALSTIKPIEKTQIDHLQSTCGLMGFVLHEKLESRQKTDSSALQKLTPREREVFALLPSGASNALLAEKLNISPGTVKIHMERILSKLSLKDRTQAAVKAVEAGFSSKGF